MEKTPFEELEDNRVIRTSLREHDVETWNAAVEAVAKKVAEPGGEWTLASVLEDIRALKETP